MPEPGSNRPNEAWKAAGLVGSLGVEVALAVLGGHFAGRYIDRLTNGGKTWMIAGTLAGLVLGLAGAVLLIKRFLEDTNG
ncbi:AtpZ/AtpI family protein [Gorillibacterium timonense]|uniref:AtpZ/AtpI family protein n=1 Tax=Gorillibacterium timonense TaxID=1689269 RepID=UPI00071C7202|nr:AtpZ/AtpI family protein [Gorillibacterium timonense]